MEMRSIKEKPTKPLQRIEIMQADLCNSKSERINEKFKKWKTDNEQKSSKNQILKIKNCRLCKENVNQSKKTGCLNSNGGFNCQEEISEKVKEIKDVAKYYCNLCNYKSYYNYSVAKHQTEHENPYCKVMEIGCKDCEDNIEHKSHYQSLVDSLMKKEDSIETKRFSCNLCDYKKFYRVSIQKHQDNQHRKEDGPKVLYIGLSHLKKRKKVLRKGCKLCKENVEHPKNSGCYQRKGCELCKENVEHPKNSGCYKRNGCKLCKENVEHPKNSGCYQRKGCDLCQQNVEHSKKNGCYKMQGKFKCSYEGCEVSSNLQESLKRHIENIHMKIVKFACNLCEYKSYHKFYVEHHQKTKHNDNESRRIIRIGCELCKENIEHSTVLGCSASKGTLKCSYEGCDVSTGSEDTLKRHVEIVHLKLVKYACNICQYKSPYFDSVARHQSSHSHIESRKVLKIGCTFCDQNIEHDTHSNTMEVIHSNSLNKASKQKLRNKDIERKKLIGSLECKECDHEPFGNNRERIKHYKSEHPGKNIFNCNYCKHGANYITNLKSHIQSMHEKIELKCQMCPYKTTWKQLYSRHMRSDHGVFRNNTRNNIRGNGDGQLYLCQLCGYSTFLQNEFKEHGNCCRFSR